MEVFYTTLLVAMILITAYFLIFGTIAESKISKLKKVCYISVLTAIMVILFAIFF